MFFCYCSTVDGKDLKQYVIFIFFTEKQQQFVNNVNNHK